MKHRPPARAVPAALRLIVLAVMLLCTACGVQKTAAAAAAQTAPAAPQDLPEEALAERSQTRTPRYLFVGDSYSKGAYADGESGFNLELGWAACLARELGLSEQEWAVYGRGGAAFCREGWKTDGEAETDGLRTDFQGIVDWLAYPAIADPAGVEAVVLVGGVNGQVDRIAEQRQAAKAFCLDVKQKFPNAVLYFFYSPSCKAASPELLQPVLEGMQQGGAVCWDSSGWLVGETALFYSDSLHPLAAGYRKIAEKMARNITDYRQGIYDPTPERSASYTGFTGLARSPQDGVLYYYTGGAPDTGYTGFAWHGNKQYYVKDGIVPETLNGYCQHTDGLWYRVESGAMVEDEGPWQTRPNPEVDAANHSMDIFRVKDVHTIFLGDSYSLGARAVKDDIAMDKGWPALLARNMGLSHKEWGVYGHGGARFDVGFLNADGTEPEDRYNTFGHLLDQEVYPHIQDPSRVRTIVLVGGVNGNVDHYQALYCAALAFCRDVKEKFPNAVLYFFYSPNVEAPSPERHDPVMKGMQQGGAVCWDAAGWFVGCTELYNADRIHPNAAGYQAIADRMMEKITAYQNGVYDPTPERSASYTGFTGLSRSPQDGVLYYYANGARDTGYAGFAWHGARLYYVENGWADETRSGYCRHADGLWYRVEQGVMVQEEGPWTEPPA